MHAHIPVAALTELTDQSSEFQRTDAQRGSPRAGYARMVVSPPAHSPALAPIVAVAMLNGLAPGRSALGRLPGFAGSALDRRSLRMRATRPTLGSA